MSNSPNLKMPLLQAAQAQKHVTVNEALLRLDALAQITLQTVQTTTPPTLATDGTCYGVPSGAVNEWSGHEGDIAIRTGGGWEFCSPEPGWKAWIVDASGHAMFDGTNWLIGATALSTNGAAMIHEIIETEHTLGTGATSTIPNALPGATLVYGITGRVLSPLGGTLSTWRLGVSASSNRYGSNLGTNLGSWIRGLTYSPLTYYSDTDLLLTADGGNFDGGSIRLAIHTAILTLPEI